MIGTSIQNLNNYNSEQNLQREQGHNAAHSMHQCQQIPYYNMKNINGNNRNQQNKDLDIEELTKDINDKIIDDTFASVSDNTNELSNINILNNIPLIFRDPLIIVILFVILSQPLIKETLGKYIKQINPDSDGKFSFSGILIYGLILALLFMIVKKYLY